MQNFTAQFSRNRKPVEVAIIGPGNSEAMAMTFKIMAPQYVKAYVKTNKNDYNDAEAINEAVSRPSMRFVGIKQTWQQAIQPLHRSRSQLMKMRPQLASHIRGTIDGVWHRDTETNRAVAATTPP